MIEFAHLRSLCCDMPRGLATQSLERRPEIHIITETKDDDDNDENDDVDDEEACQDD